MNTETMTLAQVRDRLRNTGAADWSTPNTATCQVMADAIDAYLAASEADQRNCESALPDCGPVEFEDSEGVPLCGRCWNEFAQEAAQPKGEGEDAVNDLVRDICELEVAEPDHPATVCVNVHSLIAELEHAFAQRPAAQPAVADGEHPMRAAFLKNPCSVCGAPIVEGQFRGTGDGSMKDGGSFAHEACYWRQLAGEWETRARAAEAAQPVEAVDRG